MHSLFESDPVKNEMQFLQPSVNIPISQIIKTIIMKINAVISNPIFVHIFISAT